VCFVRSNVTLLSKDVAVIGIYVHRLFATTRSLGASSLALVGLLFGFGE
jgi:hypothetical protein